MRLFTVQHIAVWQTLENKGIYQTNEQFICEESFISAYQWLNDQAKKRIKGWKTDRPIWFWLKRPDLRSYRFMKNEEDPKYQEFVLIEVEIPDNEILITEFGLWHFVLNNYYIAYNDKEDKNFQKKCEQLEKKEIQKEIEESWDKCIVNSSLSLSKFDQSLISPISFQAIAQNLKLYQVVSYKKFIMTNLAKK